MVTELMGMKSMYNQWGQTRLIYDFLTLSINVF